MILRALAVGVLLSAAFAGCGGGNDEPPDSDQIRHLVDDFFEDTAAKDVEAVCGALTENGWAHAVYRRFLVDAPLRSADEDDCIRERAPAALRSVDLPAAVKNGSRPGLKRLRVIGDRATGS